METIIPICNNCGTKMVLRTKGEDRFWGCPNWKTCGGKTIPYKGERKKDKPQDVRPQQPTDLQMIFDQLQTLDKGMREVWTVLMKIQEKLNDN